jgi:GNAT superfamily N-acetyltransferase
VAALDRPGPVIQLAVGRTGCWNVAVDRAAVLAKFNDQLRRNPAAEAGSRVERDEHVTRVICAGDGWSGVVWSDLAALDPAGADTVIAAEVRRFAGLGRSWEWKYYSYDQPADLPGRLAAAGLAAEPAETLLVAEIAQLDLDVRPPAGVELVPVTGADGAAAVVRVHDEVFGGDHATVGAAITAALPAQPRPVQAVVAQAGGVAISAGRVDFPDGSDFASLWGGGTLPAWRGRGVFRSLVAYRARLAQERGYRYLQVDASPDSRPILRRLGFTELATTTPFAGPAGDL